ncbi:hypothetical protein E4U17_002707 [Claviceps sp. LM77 group G4]|nr:hypothetical protein E4U17_002707 [Claviceps sp. LM77 group G4]
MATDTWTADFAAPFEVDTLLEVRACGMGKMPGLNVPTGIDKKTVKGPGDWHDLTFHGGPDKALLGYCSSHYPNWAASHHSHHHKFLTGAFGENLVTPLMNERNVCIGDIIAIGTDVQLQVSLPRQPCFKLNHRLSLKHLAAQAYQTSRTGWYYRVLREGTIQAGDQIRLLERRFPQWTVERVQEFLHRDRDNLDMNRLLAGVEALGEEIRAQFRSRVARAEKEAKKKKKKKKSNKDKGDQWEEYKIVERRMETKNVVALTLQRVGEHCEEDGVEAPNLLGAHARLKLPNGLIRSYSIVSSKSPGILELGIALDSNSRGGSRFLHHEAKINDIIQVSRITTDIQADTAAGNHVFIAGGIGITAFLDLLRHLLSINWSCQLHYAVRSADNMPFVDRLAALQQTEGVVTIYDKSRGQDMNIPHIIESMPWNSHIYVCGPRRMMHAVEQVVQERQISPAEVHYEAFAADSSGPRDPFEVQVLRQAVDQDQAPRPSVLLRVGEEESLLEVLRREYPDMPSSCEVGNCGTCRVVLKSGRVDHRGSALLPEEKETAMLACVSRGIGRISIEV